MKTPLATTFLKNLISDLQTRSGSEVGLTSFLKAMSEVDSEAMRIHHPQHASSLPAIRYLEPALKQASVTEDIITAIRDLVPIARWYQVFGGHGIDPALAEGLLAAQVVGPVGMIAANNLRCGLFLLAPQIHYPHHTHAASEIYYCVSGSLEVTHGLNAEPFLLCAGDLSITPPNRLHSLTTGNAPVLLIYVWTGQVNAPNWWWEKQGDGNWWRNKWMRAPDGSWRLSNSEAVTSSVLHKALNT